MGGYAYSLPMFHLARSIFSQQLQQAMGLWFLQSASFCAVGILVMVNGKLSLQVCLSPVSHFLVCRGVSVFSFLSLVSFVAARSFRWLFVVRQKPPSKIQNAVSSNHDSHLETFPENSSKSPLHIARLDGSSRMPSALYSSCWASYPSPP
ncbi:hypothetical protein EDB81DRAFT_64667 [Dactylonectria macrodidyma]|uniref:Uncharacterized protein n=1 Tax=Dactylonectria macrodidyma TaxID=307937 RepID=A0A9P9EMZ6_9HYPO|nr:hypothetical protein EDB81DRAFT_64667 [Dactylonectria macrodidyma]